MADNGRVPAGFAFAFWTGLSAVSFAAFMSLQILMPLHYKFHEPVFTGPVESGGTPYVLRNDSMGDGHFGASRSNRRKHNGIDIKSRVGVPVLASKSGRVIFSGTKGGYGQYIQVLHPDGLDTRYAHLSELRVKTGQWVKRGETIGLIGKTGNAQYRAIIPHLHFEIRRGEEPVDPTPYFFGRSS